MLVDVAVDDVLNSEVPVRHPEASFVGSRASSVEFGGVVVIGMQLSFTQLCLSTTYDHARICRHQPTMSKFEALADREMAARKGYDPEEDSEPEEETRTARLDERSYEEAMRAAQEEIPIDEIAAEQAGTFRAIILADRAFILIQ